MPCQLPDDLSCVTDDVFSYMCSLAMEKCSKKSEKKKASCGGAAMRKRLLIKNFVAQMLAQERQNCGSPYVTVNRDDYENTDDHESPTLISLNNSMVANSSMEVDSVEEEEGEEDESGLENSFASSSSNYRQLMSVNFLTTPVSNCNAVEVDEEEEEDDDDEEEETEEDDYEDEEEVDELRRCSASTDSTLHSNTFCSMNQQCSTLMNSASNLYMHPHHSSGIMCSAPSNQYNIVASNGVHFEDVMSPCSSLMSPCSSMMSPVCTAPLYTTTHFYDSTGVAMSAVPVPGSSTSMGVSSLPSTMACLSSMSRSSDWEDFHTVPPSRDYLMDDENLLCQEHGSLPYSMYQSYSTRATPLSNLAEFGMHFQTLPQLNCPSALPLIPTNNLARTSSVCMTGLSIPDDSAILNNGLASECSEVGRMEPDVSISNCISSGAITATALSVVETLPENFLDEVSPTNFLKSTDLAQTLMWGDEKKSNDICFWDDNNNNGDIADHKNDELIYSGLSSIPQHMTVSSSSLPPPSSAFHSLVTMVPSMIKFGNCRSEVHQTENNYRRCITDLDTNTVVEEDYGNSTGYLMNNSGSGFYHSSLNQNNCSGGYLSRKRPISPFFIDHLGTTHEIMDGGLGSSGGAGSPNSGNNVCNLMMLTTSPKRIKL